MHSKDMQRLLAPRSVALIGGVWADAVASASRVIGYRGEIWHVHPSRESTPDRRYFASVEALPEAPDACFIAAPAHTVPAIAASLRTRAAGGFVCFAAGFAETGSETGTRLNELLLQNAGELPFFGPNCYGFINFFDRVALWPDQVVGSAPDRGVALICQSGTIALNLLFNQRSLPIGYVLTVGNQARIAVEDMLDLLSEDGRVSAFGLYMEGIDNPAAFARAVAKARAAGKAVALVKAGRTEAATRTVRTHTGALAGADAAFDAFCQQAGIARCDSLATLCETLKLLHCGGPLRGRRILVMGASGGDMAMTADAARSLALQFPPIPAASQQQMQGILSDRVAIANPFDFHTHIWFDRTALRALFHSAQRAGFDAVGLMVDCPTATGADASSYVAAIEEFVGAAPGADCRAVVISSLPESMAAATRELCLSAGITPLQGQREALEALDLAAQIGAAWQQGPAPPLSEPERATGGATARNLTEVAAKAALAECGVRVPRHRLIEARHHRDLPQAAAAAASSIGFPVVVKAVAAQLEHKTDVGGVILNIRSPEEAAAAAQQLLQLADTLLVEEMIVDGIAEMLVGIRCDAQFGQLLLLGAGGIYTELLRDSVTLLPPFGADRIRAALERLRIMALMRGFRGRPAADVEALLQAVLGCVRYAQAQHSQLLELDVNPVIVRAHGLGAVAVDALIRLSD
jgi:acetyl-CoA synthetase